MQGWKDRARGGKARVSCPRGFAGWPVGRSEGQGQRALSALRFLGLGHRQEGSLAEKVRFRDWQDGRTGLGGCLTFGCDRLVGRPHRQDGGTGGEAECASGLNFNGVQYRLEAGHTQARRTRPEEKSQQTT